MAFLNRNLWKNAYLLEFWQTSLEDAFTFSVPPQAEDFTYPQRINETKTFGGSVFEDYGNDTIQITLSGTTINQELKLIYCEKNGIKNLNGEDEIFYLKDLIEKYGKFNKLKNKKIFLYALTNRKKNETQNHKCFQVWIQDLQIKRTKDKPFAYDYTLKMIGLPLTKTRVNKQGKISGAVESRLSELAAGIAEWKNNAAKQLNKLNGLGDIIGDVESAFLGIQEGYNTYTQFLADGFYNISDKIQEVDAFGEILVNTVMQPTGNSQLFIAMTDMVESVATLKTWWQRNKPSEAIKNAANQMGVSVQEFQDAMTKLISKTNTSTNKLYQELYEEMSEQHEFPLVVPGGYGKDDEVIMAYGYKEYQVTSGDTWSDIAFKFYGDPSYSTMLQLYNSNISLTDMNSGDYVYIPLINDNRSSITNNQVYPKFGVKDQLGSDIALVDGDYAVVKHDLGISKGMQTLEQAINNRLRTSINTRVRNVVYGIRNESGLADDKNIAAASYISTAVEQTIMEDPRVQNIENISWEGVESGIAINVTYTTFSGLTTSFKGVF